MDELLSIKDLTVRFYAYDGIVNALDDVNLTIVQNETYGLVGETGCGKTVTALSILRLVPPPGRIEHGNICFYSDGEEVDLLAIDEDEIRQMRGNKISMIFQEPSSALEPVYTIGDQISEAILLHRQQELNERALDTIEMAESETGDFLGILFAPARFVEKAIHRAASLNPDALLPRIIGRTPIVRRLLWRTSNEANKMATALLKEVEIPDANRVIRQHPHELSGGMKQRSVIAMALACNPKFLIADEPTTALDVTIQSQILELLRKLKSELDASILYITHDLGVAAEICDRIGVMYAGRICEESEVGELYSKPAHPYTQALMAAVPKPGQHPSSISGTVPDLIEPPPGCRFHPRCNRCKSICSEEIPVMREIAPKHYVACHLY
jgi:peptide/nickel transport system ATP-binding protein